jgi:biopolymer transport protein ExbD
MAAPKPKTPRKMQPPMTPMIDCTFNLLIFFLLSPSFSASDGFLTTNLPHESGMGRQDPGVVARIKVEIVQEGEDVYVRLPETGEEMAGGSPEERFQGLYAALNRLRQGGTAADRPVLLAPTMNCKHKWVVRGFDEAVRARFTNIQFAVPYT